MVAICRHCNEIFNSYLFKADGETAFNIYNTTLSCTRCGYKADALEGTFTFDQEGNTTLLSGSSFTIDAFKRCKTIIKNNTGKL